MITYLKIKIPTQQKPASPLPPHQLGTTTMNKYAMEGWEREERSDVCTERQNWSQDCGDRWEGAEADTGTCRFPVGPTGWCAAAWSLCRHRLSPQTHCQVVGSPWLCSLMEAQDEKQFTFWIGPPRRTTVVHDAHKGHVGPCLRPWWSLAVWSLCRWLKPWRCPPALLPQRAMLSDNRLIMKNVRGQMM